MRKTWRTALAVAVISAGSAAGAAADCAPYITSGADDEPMSGSLVGSKRVTATISGGAFGWRGTYAESYDVGVYRMADGSTIELTCHDYKPFSLRPV